METPSRYTFNLDGTTVVFPIPTLMKGDNYVKIEVDGVEITDRNKFDLVNNAVVFVSAATVPQGSQLDVLVVQSDEGIANLGSTNAIDIVSQNINNINAVATDLSAVNNVNTNMASVTNVSTNMSSVVDAVNQANAASSSATAAANSAAAAATSYDHFDDRYLGAKAVAPSVDNDGDPLVEGAFYWNTVENKMYVWDGSSWIQATGAAEVSKTFLTATQDQTDFTIPTAQDGMELVYLNGVILSSVDYSRPDATTIRLTVAADAGDELLVVVNTLVDAGGFVQKNGDTINGDLDVTGYVLANSIDATVVGTGSVIAPSGQHLSLGADLSEDVRIDTSGNVGIGTNSPSTILTVNRKTTDGSIIDLKKDGTTVGSIGAAGGKMHLSSYSASYECGIRLNPDNTYNCVMPSTQAGAVNDNSIDLGYFGGRWKDLYLSGGVYLGGTGSANYLDDYEEGTFTPSISFGGGTTGITYANRQGRYVKVGQLVQFVIFIELSNKGSSTGNARIDDLPFNQNSTTYQRARAQIGYYSWSGTDPRDGRINYNTNTIDMLTGQELSFNTDANFTNITQLYISGVYQTS